MCREQLPVLAPQDPLGEFPLGSTSLGAGRGEKTGSTACRCYSSVGVLAAAPTASGHCSPRDTPGKETDSHLMGVGGALASSFMPLFLTIPPQTQSFQGSPWPCQLQGSPHSGKPKDMASD